MTRLFAVLLAALALPVAAQPTADSLRVLIPLYVFPDRPGDGDGRDEWRRVAAIAGRVPVTVIVNPSNGPRPAGTGDHTAYTEGLPILDSARIRVLGYVRTCYLGMGLTGTQRPQWCRGLSDASIAGSIADDIATWVEDYPDFVEGIFLDEAAYERVETTGPIYTQLCRDVRAAFANAGAALPDPVVLLNPGTRSPANYTASGDCDGAVLFENPAVNFPPATLAADVAAHGTARSGALLYDVDAVSDVTQAVQTAEALGLSYIYVTDDPAPDFDPWDTVPSAPYLAALADAVEAANAPSTTTRPTPGALALDPPVPNPATGPVMVALHLTASMPVRAEVIDLLGRRVAVLHDGVLATGSHRLAWAADVAAGAYTLRVMSGEETRTVRVVLAR